jgi:uncharacterized membrane protein
MKHIGNLTITSENCKRFANLTEVTGYLYINAEASLPVLTSVGGYLRIDAEASLPVLTSVGGDLYINAEASLPVLTSVGGALYIDAEASLPVLTSVGGYLYIDAEASLPVLTSAHGVRGALLAVSKYGLWRSDEGLYYAGCRVNLTKDKALAHWGRGDDRALLFASAINSFEAAQ